MTINRDYTETHRVRPGRLAARLRVNVLLVISGQLLGRSVPPPPPPTPPPLLRLFLILCPSFRTPLSPSLSLSFSSTWSRFLPRCLDVRWGHRCRRARSPFNADPSSVGSAPCAAPPSSSSRTLFPTVERPWTRIILLFDRSAAISKSACQFANKHSCLRHGIKMDRIEWIGVSKVRVASYFRPLRYAFVNHLTDSSQWNIYIYIFVRFVQSFGWSSFIHLNERGESHRHRWCRNKRHDRQNLPSSKNCERVRSPGNHREPSFQSFSKRVRELLVHCFRVR